MNEIDYEYIAKASPRQLRIGLASECQHTLKHARIHLDEAVANKGDDEQFFHDIAIVLNIVTAVSKKREFLKRKRK